MGALDALEPAAQHVGVTDKRGNEALQRSAVDLLWRAELANSPLRHYRQPIGKAQRLALIVGDEDGGDPQLALDFPQLHLHRRAQVLVERRKRLVEQQYGRIDHERAGQRHALLLSAGELARLATRQASELAQTQHLGDPTVDLRLRNMARLEAIRDVALDGHVREQRVILKHHPDFAIVGRQIIDPFAIDQDFAALGAEKAGGEIKGVDVRDETLQIRKLWLSKLLKRSGDGIIYNDHDAGAIGPRLFEQACLLGLEGIV